MAAVEVRERGGSNEKSTSGGRKRIVIIGGGFAGVSVARALEKHKSNQKYLQIFLVDTKGILFIILLIILFNKRVF